MLVPSSNAGVLCRAAGFLVPCAPPGNLPFRDRKWKLQVPFNDLGAASLLISWILLLIAAWREEYAWGMFALLLPPVVMATPYSG